MAETALDRPQRGSKTVTRSVVMTHVAIFTHSPASWRRATYEPLVRAARLCGSGPPLALGAGGVSPAEDPVADLQRAGAQLDAARSLVNAALARCCPGGVPPVRRA